MSDAPAQPETAPVAEAPAEAAAPAAPREQSRIDALDVARGFALLGIFLVNIDLMALPFGLIEARPAARADSAVWLFVSMFCEGKFYPLFSLLFGMGLALQRQNVLAAGGNFVPLYLRRLALLACFGLLHGLALWYGDILFVYSLAGLLLLAASPLPGRVLLGISGVLWVLGVLAVMSLVSIAALSGEGISGDTPREELLAEALATEVPEDLWETLGSGEIDSPEWLATEISAYRDGPATRAFGFRAVSFALSAGLVLFAGLDILAMFALGAALIRLGLFERTASGELNPWFARFLAGAMLLGMPMAAASVILPVAMGPWGDVLGQGLRVLGGPLLSLGYLSALTLALEANLLGRLLEHLAAAGRMALTNYLSQSLLATFVMYHWGLGQFGTWNGVERALLVLGIFIAQLFLSRLWLRHFRFGPLEWVWRSLTYLRRQPLRKA